MKAELSDVQIVMAVDTAQLSETTGVQQAVAEFRRRRREFAERGTPGAWDRVVSAAKKINKELGLLEQPMDSSAREARAQEQMKHRADRPVKKNFNVHRRD